MHKELPGTVLVWVANTCILVDSFPDCVCKVSPEEGTLSLCTHPDVESFGAESSTDETASGACSVPIHVGVVDAE